MLDTLTSNNRQDFNQRYVGTIGWYIDAENEKKQLAYINSVNDNLVMFSDISGIQFAGRADKGVTFEFIPINKGYFNTTSGVFFLERVPARQWKRGISPNNTRVYQLADGQLLQKEISIKVIDQIFNKAVPLLTAYKQWCEDTKGAFALSRHFAISASSLYFGMWAVGTVNNRIIELTNPIIQQELTDTIRRNNLEIEVRG